ncbi:MAG: amino acid ABC transporter permease [Flavobacteriaceae bacterium]
MDHIDFSIVLHVWPHLWQGLKFSFMLTVAAFAIGMVLGTIFAIIQHLQVPVLSPIVKTYITIMRSIPLILVLFWFFFLVPIVLGYFSSSGRPIPIGPVYAAYITFGLFEAAYYSEIMRVGLRSISRGQFEAAQALALSTFQTYRFVIMPQVLRVTAPIILSQTIILFQDTSLVYVVSLTDLLGAASKIAQLNGRLIEMYVTVAIIYLLICSALSQIVTFLKKRAEPMTR